MALVPTVPADSAQQVDQTYGPDGLTQEIIHNYPPDGGGTRRWIDDRGQEQTEPVSGLPIPAPAARTAEDRLAEAHQVLEDGAAEIAALPAPTTPADVSATMADILARAAAALNGGV